MCQKLAVSERRACKVLGQARATQQREVSFLPEEQRLTADIIALATQYGRYGYRRVTALLNSQKHWKVNHKRVERIWRKEYNQVHPHSALGYRPSSAIMTV